MKLRRILLKSFCCIVSLVSAIPAWGGTNYYAKVTANVRPTGAGTVYARTNNGNGDTAEKSTATGAATRGGNVQFTFTANPQGNYDFKGWTSEDNVNATPLSTDNPYSQSYAASTTEGEENATSYNIYAIFVEKPLFYFSATAEVSPSGAGTATPNPTTAEVRAERWNSESATTNTITFTATPGADYAFFGWSRTEGGEIESSNNPYTPTLTSTSKNSVTPTNTTLYARFMPYPTGITATPTSIVLGVGESSNPILATISPEGTYKNIVFESSNTSIATVDANGVVTAGSTAGTATITVKALKSDNVTVIATATVAVSVLEKCATPVITINPSSGGNTGEVTISSATPDVTIYYTTDGSSPTTSSTVYNGVFNINNGQTVKAIAARTGYWESEIASVTFTAAKVETPVINITPSGVTFSSDTPDATFYYTINGDDPTTSLTPWNGTPITGVSEGATIKVIAAKAGMITSDVVTKQYFPASGVSGNTVILNDYEDHNWTYYSGVDASVDGGNYNTNYAGKLYSPNPRNVKITYKANGGAVSIDESETEFVYYKTLEQGTTAGQYPYTVISNPFSKRPTGKGFGGWRIKEGAEYINGYADEAILPLDAELTLTGLDANYTPNCTSAEIELEATWEDLNNIVRRTDTGDYTYSATGGTYETNILVIQRNQTGTITVSSPCTIMMVEPDGSDDYRDNYTFTGNITPNNAGVTKIEFTKWNSTNTLNCNNHSVTIGRGMITTSQCASYVTGVSSSTRNNNVPSYNVNLNYHLKLESGKFTDVSFIAGTVGTNGYVACNGTSNQVKGTLGNDYDRAKEDNTKLIVSDELFLGYRPTYGNGNQNNATFTCWVKSGNLCSETNVTNTTFNNQGSPNGGYYGEASQVFYVSSGGAQTNIGKRMLYVEGGILSGIAGGIDQYNPADNESFFVRMTGGQVRGVVYGSGAFAASSGIRRMIFTGGQINGWVAAGCNGTDPAQAGGTLPSDTYIYVGGNTHIGNATDLTLNTSSDGNVFGAGSGNSAQATTGQVNNSNVVIADDSYIKNNVYGGGNFGYSNATATVYITGGEVLGSVFGGSNQKQGVAVNVNMTGGQVDKGVYGGSNITGTLSGSVAMNINGGQVGTSSNPANIHGGGYGVATRVSQNVDITLGTTGQTTPGVIVYGDVYGGSALGYVNGETATNTYHTNVTMNKGVINGSLYGGGLGDGSNAANVYGPVAVTVNGGTVNTTSADGSGAVYGCNNINGAPQRAVAVVINGTDPAPSEGAYALDAVYGGGNRANYSYGTPTVTVKNCDNSIGYVYGGGNAAHITNGNTNVTIYGGNKIGNVFGGGNGTVSAANVSGNTDVKIYGGTIGSVYGGSNTRGTIDGTINVLVNKTSSCAMHIDEVYGGGNMAPSNAGNVTIGCTGDEGEGIGDVYGGANAADITGNVSLLITGGSIERVFGGNNASGNVSGDIAVNIDWTDSSTCGYNYLGYVYGAGNKADYAGSPVVNIKNGTVSHDVFGGGLQANVGDSVTVNMLGGSVEGALYGGGALAHTNTNGGTTSVNLVGGTVHDIYGGGLGQKKGFNDATEDIEAYVNGNVTVTLNGSNEEGATNDCKVTGNIFGCNNLNGSPKGNVVVNIRKTVGTDKTTGEKNNTTYDVAAVYGGGNMAAYVPSNPETTDAKATVNIFGCGDTSIQYVYGGGNAASVPASEVTVHGCYEIGYVFGGGNGRDKLPNGQDNPGANVGYYTYEYNGQTGEVISGTRKPYGTGVASVKLLGGRIHSAFGGSNTKGNVRSAAVAFLDEADDQCLLHIDDVYGGGNEAYMEGNAQIKLGCITSLAVIYGGSKRANVGGDIVLNITSGHFDRIFGGNNESGYINGSITVNIEETGCHPITIGELYGCGNQAPYITPTGKADPTVNVKSFTSIGRIFGGGLGEGAVVTGNPTVNINEVVGKNASYNPSDWDYPGKTIPFSEGDVTLPEHTAGAIGVIGEVFGGGNAADVKGNTTVNIGTAETVDYVSTVEKGIKVEGANILGNVYGGGNNADVSGKANVVVGRN